MKKIRIAGPPGTGKTTTLVHKYYELLEKYSPINIQLISHTNAASDHLREQIKKPESIEAYCKENKTNLELFKIIQESKKTLDDHVSTIHTFCKTKIKGKAFLIEDYEILINLFPLFNKFTRERNFKSVDSLFKFHPFFEYMSRSRDHGMSFYDFYKELSFEEKDHYKYTLDELERLYASYNSFKVNQKVNLRTAKILDFQDMIEDFAESKEAQDQCRHIKVLIVDEAQDSSVVQRKAELSMSKNVDLFYKAGDPDQSIFEFSGADPDSFHKEFAHPEIELKQGYRCPRTVNEYCKNIIKPVWDHYGYSREWLPKEGAEGAIYELSSLHQDPYLEDLDNLLLNTKQTAVFTYRGGQPIDIIKYLIRLGLPFAIPFNSRVRDFTYPSGEINNQRAFINLHMGEMIPFSNLKKLLKSVHPDYRGPNHNSKKIEQVSRGSYGLDWLIKKGFLVPGVQKTTDFQDICVTQSPAMREYIKKVVSENRDLEKKRIFVENIHTIKGKEFDHVVVDLTLTKKEEDFVRRRMKFVACSRSKETLWLVKSRTKITM